jgi:hypothetical protein
LWYGFFIDRWCDTNLMIEPFYEDFSHGTCNCTC